MTIAGIIAGAWSIGTAAVTFCAAVATRLPRPRQDDPRWYCVVYAVANAIGLNIGHARNARCR